MDLLKSFDTSHSNRDTAVLRNPVLSAVFLIFPASALMSKVAQTAAITNFSFLVYLAFYLTSIWLLPEVRNIFIFNYFPESLFFNFSSVNPKCCLYNFLTI